MKRRTERAAGCRVAQENRALRRQRDTLARYLVGGGSVEADVCRPLSREGRCPFCRPPYETQKNVCVSCVIRALCGGKDEKLGSG